MENEDENSKAPTGFTDQRVSSPELSNVFYTGESLRAAQEQAESASVALAQLNALLPSVAQLEDSYRTISDLTEQNKKLQLRVEALEKRLAEVSQKSNNEVTGTVQDYTDPSIESDQRIAARKERMQRRAMSDSGELASSSKEAPFKRKGFDVLTRIASKYEQDTLVGMDALSRMPVLNDPVQKPSNSHVSTVAGYRSTESMKRSGFRLLLCSDEVCNLQRVEEGFISLPHLTKTLIKLKFISKPKLVLITKRPNDRDTTKVLLQVAEMLEKESILVMVEETVVQQLGSLATRNMVGRNPSQFHLEPIDLIVCLGGDGTIIWTSSAFPRGIPPIASFSMGSLGFLSPFPPNRIQQKLEGILNEENLASIRSRIAVQITKFTDIGKRRIEAKYLVLNEITVDRGPSSSIVQLKLYVDNKKDAITNVQGDGIIIATPTGSTAYSLASGGSMIHPAIPAMCVTPICPHSLSFRPIVIADSSFLKLEVPRTARTSAWISFDGQKRMELKQGDYLTCRISAFPVTCFCSEGESADWLAAIKDGFLWNVRKLQRSTSLQESAGKL